MVLVSKLYLFGFHIGHDVSCHLGSKNYKSVFYSGVRNKVVILNLKKTVFLLRKSMVYLRTLVKHENSLLLYFSTISNDSLTNLTNTSFLKKKTCSLDSVSFLHLGWTPGLITNYNTCFLKFVQWILRKIKTGFRKSKELLQRSEIVTYSKSYYFKKLFLKLFYILRERSALGLDIHSEFKNMAYFWRIIIFLRYWKSYFFIPDLVCSIDPLNTNSASKEFSLLKIPVIGILDSDSNSESITYPIVMNDDSFLSFFFFYSIIINIVKSQRTKVLI